MKYALISIALLLNACSSYTHISDSPNVWVSKKGGPNENLYWCEAGDINKRPPTCYSVKILEPGSRLLTEDELKKVRK